MSLFTGCQIFSPSHCSHGHMVQHAKLWQLGSTWHQIASKNQKMWWCMAPLDATRTWNMSNESSWWACSLDATFATSARHGHTCLYCFGSLARVTLLQRYTLFMAQPDQAQAWCVQQVLLSVENTTTLIYTMVLTVSGLKSLDLMTLVSRPVSSMAFKIFLHPDSLIRRQKHNMLLRSIGNHCWKILCHRSTTSKSFPFITLPPGHQTGHAGVWSIAG